MHEQDTWLQHPPGFHQQQPLQRTTSAPDLARMAPGGHSAMGPPPPLPVHLSMEAGLLQKYRQPEVQSVLMPVCVPLHVLATSGTTASCYILSLGLAASASAWRPACSRSTASPRYNRSRPLLEALLAAVYLVPWANMLALNPHP